MYPRTPGNHGKRPPLSSAHGSVRADDNRHTRSAVRGSANPGSGQVQVPLSAVFDDLMRNYDDLTNYGCEKEFKEFVSNQEKCRKKWLDAELERVRGQKEISDLQSEHQRTEKRVEDVRRQMESKIESLNRVELDNDRMRIRVSSAMTLCKSYLNDLGVGDEVKNNVSSILAVLQGVEYNRNQPNLRSPGIGLEAISEVTQQVDISMTYSEDGLDLSVSRRTRSRKNAAKRSSVDKCDSLLAAREPGSGIKMRRSSGVRNAPKKTVHLSGPPGQTITNILVNLPQTEPDYAASTLESITSNSNKRPATFVSTDLRIAQKAQPTASPTPAMNEPDTDTDSAWRPTVPTIKPYYQTRSALSIERQHSFQQQPPNESPRFGRTLSTTGVSMHPHRFAAKTVLKPELCEPCGKRIKFSKPALKCKECKATCHPECEDKVPLPCVFASTPVKKRQMGIIADYVPSTHPMVPALIQHCVNEVETRLSTTTTTTNNCIVGLYRVPASQKEVEDLKARFLSGKGVPNLGPYNVHTVCGCIKKFLGSLREPLIGRWFWRDFDLATEISDPDTRQTEIKRILTELPPPNQDTLAFLILHLQGITEVPEVMMKIETIVKVFGPIMVGFSNPDIDESTKLKEREKQEIIAESLLSISSEFWKEFINRPTPTQEINGRNTSLTD